MECIQALEGPNINKKMINKNCCRCGIEVYSNLDEPMCMKCEDEEEKIWAYLKN